MTATPPLRIEIISAPPEALSWLDVFSGLLTPVIAVLAAYIAYQQYHVDRRRFRAELYERRLKVYRALQVFLSEILRQGKTDSPRCSQFYAEVSEVTFLFDRSVQEYIDKIFEEAIDLVSLHEQMYPSDGSDGLPVGEERSKVGRQNAEKLKWLMKQLSESKKIFSEKMGLEFR